MYTIVDGVTYLVTGADADADGFYHGDTRHLSPLAVSLDDVSLSLLDDRRRRPSGRTRLFADVPSSVNEISGADKHAAVVAERRQDVREGRLVDRLVVGNYAARRRTFGVTVEFDADFADIFEIRGIREAAARDASTEVDDDAVTYAYTYSDAGATRKIETVVRFDAEPTALAPGRARFRPSLDPGEQWQVTTEVTPRGDESTVRAVETAGRPDQQEEADASAFVIDGPIETGDAGYDRTFAQARQDLEALTTTTDHGDVPLAGAPWFVTVFGRDAILAAYLLLPVAPALARGTLRYLAAHQGSRRDDHRDEQSGKILHEVRRGELARTGTIPQTPYYGTVDATPLWVVLLHETWRWTGDDALVEELWPNLDRALDWLDRAVAAVGDDPFLYYRDLGSGGVAHKVWRDSPEGVQYPDGTQAAPPLAGADVQGYVYDALSRASELASVVGDDRAGEFAERAERVADRFHDEFWLPDREFYATALTADGRQVDSITSTPGHCLWSGVVHSSVTEQVADRLLSPDLFSGWGIRTLSADHEGYSPVSYHAGGVWPHDNALAALGLANYGFVDAAETVATGQLDAFSHFDGHSVPELFCGFDDSTPPTPYRSACRPQAWSAATPFAFLRALFSLAPGESPSRSPDRVDSDAAADVVDYWRRLL